VRTITLEGGTLERRELQQGQGKGKQGFKGTSKGKVKAKAREEDQRLAKQEGRTKAKGALLQEASRDIFKGLQGFREGLLLYQVHL
jgi:hypothetical protein